MLFLYSKAVTLSAASNNWLCDHTKSLEVLNERGIFDIPYPDMVDVVARLLYMSVNKLEKQFNGGDIDVFMKQAIEKTFSTVTGIEIEL